MTAGPSWLAAASRTSPWHELRVGVVGGLGVSGFAAADALIHLGANVVVLDDADSPAAVDKATLLEILGAEVRSGPGSTTTLPDHLDLVVTAPGLPPSATPLRQAVERDVTVWGEVELGWRLRDPEHPTPWLCLTGTNGKTTTVRMLESMLRAGGRRAVAVGNVGMPVCEVVMDPQPYDVLAVELSSHQLHYLTSLSAQASAVLNLAPDHLGWHGSFEAYAADEARIYEHCKVACVYSVEDAATRVMVEEAEVEEGCRAIGFTLSIPSVGEVGVVDGVLADRAFVEGRRHSAAELAEIRDVPTGAPHNVANALAAAALARAHGVRPSSVRDGLRAFTLDPHRIQTVQVVGGVTYVDDSKATNPHAAAASLTAFDSIVWIAGGLAKGATADEFAGLVGHAAPRLRAAVLIGVDRRVIADALVRHAPDVPVIEVPGTDTGVMERAVREAARVATPGDTVLLAPACASQDIFNGYADRGDAFASAVSGLGA